MSDNNNFNFTSEDFSQLSSFTFDNMDFNTMADELNSLTESIISKLPEPSPEAIKEYQDDIDAMISASDKYSDKYDELDRQTLNHAVRIEYASGGECLHRGYYCPSPLLDRLVGGCNRGNKLLKPRANSRYYYKYYYDGQNRLIRCDKHMAGRCLEIEFMIYGVSNIYGFTFSAGHKSITLLSLEKYSDHGALDQYITVLPDMVTGKKHHQIHTSEKYGYGENNQISQVIFFSGGVPKLKLLNEDTYRILYDEHQSISGFERI